MKKQTLCWLALYCCAAGPATYASEPALPKINPWLTKSSYGISHHNAAQTDVTPVDGPTIGKQLTLDDAKTVPLLWCSAPIYKHVGKDTIVVASNPMGLIKVRASGEDFELISNVPYPGREEVHAEVTEEKIMEVMADIDNNRLKKQDWRLLGNTWSNPLTTIRLINLWYPSSTPISSISFPLKMRRVSRKF